MGRIHAIKRALFARDHFTHDKNRFRIPIDLFCPGLDVVAVDSPEWFPPWYKDLSNNRKLYINREGGGPVAADIQKKLKTESEWFTVAVDFDGVINPYPPRKPFPFMDEPDQDVIKVINRLFMEGFCIIIWTVRGGKLIKPLKEYLHKNGILFHYINENPEFDCKYKNLSRKIAASVYWDDRNVCHVDNPDIAYHFIVGKYRNALPVDPRQCGVGIESNT